MASLNIRLASKTPTKLFELRGVFYLYLVGAGGYIAACSCPVTVEELASGLVQALVRMGTEVIPLSLKQVGREPLGTVTIIEAKGS